MDEYERCAIMMVRWNSITDLIELFQHVVSDVINDRPQVEKTMIVNTDGYS